MPDSQASTSLSAGQSSLSSDTRWPAPIDTLDALHCLQTLPLRSALSGPALIYYNARSQRDRTLRLLDAERLVRVAEPDKQASYTQVQSLIATLEARMHSAKSQLDSKQITAKAFVDQSLKDLLHAHGLMVPAGSRSEFFEVLGELSQASAKRSWRARLEVEIVEATERQWFVVFDTITYNPRLYSDDVMFGPGWRRYLRAVQHSVLRRVFGSMEAFKRSGESISDYVRYVAVPEAHKSGRIHIHILWFLADLPDTCSRTCPNWGRRVPYYRQINDWPPFAYGQIAMRLAVRYKGDAFTLRLGWRWPTDKSGRRIAAINPVATARYVAKYLDKPRPENLRCRRVRATPGLGLKTLRSHLNHLSLNQLVLLLRHPQQKRRPRYIKGNRIPSQLFRAQIIRILSLKIRPTLSRLTTKSLHSLEAGLEWAPPPRPLVRYSPSILSQRISRLANFIDSTMRSMTATDISELDDFLTDPDGPSFFGVPPVSLPAFCGAIDNAQRTRPAP